MRLLQFATTSDAGRRRHLGALVDGSVDAGTVVDLSAAVRSVLDHDGVSRAGVEALGPALGPAGMLELIQGGAATRDAAERALEHVVTSGAERDPSGARLRYDAATLELLPAITAPPMLRDFMAFEQHLLNVFPRLGREIPPEWYERPVYYKANTASLGAHRQPVAFPRYAQRLDFEFEFAAILGRDGTNIREEQAAGHIFGYTIYNDLSAREIQQREMTVGLGPAKGKDFHNAHVLGPIVVTADELPDPYALVMTGTVNGDTWTTGSSADMHWRFEQMIAYASSDEPLRAGEVFGSGTVGGGSGAEQDRWLEPGDVVSLTVGGLGTLTNPVIAAVDTAASWEHR
jgi:2-keto-4-pentenoate hydratase/2-oxohepta-3-ene-1,7-dioic acid hydratase in catechol pathway